MTKTYEFFKEDIEPEELDLMIYKKEQELLLMQALYEEKRQKGPKLILGKVKGRYKNRKFEKYGKHRTSSPEQLPF